MGDFETEADIIFNESVSNMEEHQCISRINSRCTDDSMPFILQETVEEDEEFEQLYLNSTPSVNKREYPHVAVAAIYVSVLLEAFAWSAVVAIYIPYLVNSDSVHMTCLFFSTVVFTSAFLSGFITDNLLPRFWAISAGFIFYLLGYIMLYLASHKNICDYVGNHSHQGMTCISDGFKTLLGTGTCACTVLISLLIMGFGRGTVYASTLVFGADQIPDSNFIAVFVHGHYFSFQLGCALLYILYGFTEETKDNSGLLVGIGLSVCFLAFVSFLLGSRFYQKEHTRHLEDPFIHILRAVSCNISCRLRMFSNPTKINDSSQSLEYDILEARQVITVGEIERSYLDGVRRYFRLMLVFLVLTPFKVIFNDQDDLYDLQRQYMIWPNWTINSDNELIPSREWVVVGFGQIMNMMLVPVVLLVWSCSPSGGQTFPFTRDIIRVRLVGGLILGALSIILFGVVSLIKDHIDDHCEETSSDPISCSQVYKRDDVNYIGSGLRIEWQIPQCIIAQISDILVQLTAVQLAYLEAPDNQHFRMNSKFVCLLFLNGVIGRALGSLTNRWGTSYFCEYLTGDDRCQLLEKKFSVYLFTVGGIEATAALGVWLALEDYFKWTASGKGFLF